MLCRVAVIALTATALASTASGQVTTQRSVSAEFAADLAREALGQCKAKGHNVSVAVVDQAGMLKAFVRGDGAGLATVEVAQRKAYTAAAFGIPSSALAQAASQPGSAPANIPYLPNMFVVAGGVPLKVDNQTVGAVGMSGAPGGQADVECIEAALAKLGPRLK